jgi:hypothetical protein
VPLRIASGDSAVVSTNVVRSRQIQDEMWAVFSPVVASGHSPDLMSSLGESLTDIISLDQARIVSGLYARVPETVLWLLLAGSALSLAMVGYTAGIKGRRSLLSAVVMVLGLGIVLALVIDLDRPQDGLVNVSQQPIIEVQQRIGLPGDG